MTQEIQSRRELCPLTLLSFSIWSMFIQSTTGPKNQNLLCIGSDLYSQIHNKCSSAVCVHPTNSVQGLVLLTVFQEVASYYMQMCNLYFTNFTIVTFNPSQFSIKWICVCVFFLLCSPLSCHCLIYVLFLKSLYN